MQMLLLSKFLITPAGTTAKEKTAFISSNPSPPHARYLALPCFL